MIEVTDGFEIDKPEVKRWHVDVTQKRKYTDTITAEFDSVTSAAKFALTCLENVDHARVVITAKNYSDDNEED